MSPSLSAINQNLFSVSSFFIVPTSPDYFSVMAIDSLAAILPGWIKWAERASTLPTLLEATYPFPKPTAKFLGTVIQKYRPRSGGAAQAFQRWIDEVNKAVVEKLIPTFAKSNMLLPPETYAKAKLSADYSLATIPDFNTLIAQSQKHQTPVFELSSEQLEQVGVVLEKTEKSRDNFKGLFTEMTDRIIALTS